MKAAKDAVIAHLEADVDLFGIVTDIYDGRVPEDAKAVYPYIVSGDGNEVDSTLILAPASNLLGEIKVWGLQRIGNIWYGRRQVEIILDLIHKRLHRAKLTLQDHKQIRLKRESMFTLGDPNPKIVQGIYRYRMDYRRT